MEEKAWGYIGTQVLLERTRKSNLVTVSKPGDSVKTGRKKKGVKSTPIYNLDDNRMMSTVTEIGHIVFYNF